MDEAEFDQFYAATAPRLVGQLTVMLGSASEAQDCVQEAFVKAWLHRRELDLAGRPDAWVRRVAYNTGVSRWRQASSRLRAHGRHGRTDEVAPPNEDHAVLMSALRRISADQRRVIVLYHLCDLSISEVAAEVGVPVGTVKARLSRGRAALAEILGLDQARSTNDSGQEAHHA